MILLLLLFLKEYSEYFKSQINSIIQYYCDNKEVVTKVRNITKNKHHYNSNHKIKDIDTVLKKLKNTRQTRSMSYKRTPGQQQQQNQLTIAEKINIKVNRII